jgi:hypothetical protein
LNVNGFIGVPGPDRVRVERRTTAWLRVPRTAATSVDARTSYGDCARDAVGGRPIKRLQAIDATRGMPTTARNVIPARSYELTPNTTSHRARPGGVAVLSETYVPQDFRRH